MPEKDNLDPSAASQNAIPPSVSGNFDFLKDVTYGNLPSQIAKAGEARQQAIKEESEATKKAKAAEATAKSDYAQQEREKLEPLFRQREEAMGKVKLPEAFAPTQTNAEDLMSLFALTGIAGMLLGKGGGNQAAIGAQKAMTGMIQGYIAGRKDLYDREKQIFDSNVKLMEARKREITEAFETAFKEATTIGLSQAKSNLEIALAKAGADILATKVKREGIEAGAESLKELSKVLEKRAEFQNKLDAARIQARGLTERSRPVIVKVGDKNYLINPVTGQYVTDSEGNRVEAAPPAKGRGLSQQQQSFEDMVNISINEAAAQVKTLENMPLSTTGIWQGRNTKGLFDAPLGVLTNALTTEDVQRYNKIIGILGREAAKVFAGGRIITDKAADQFSDQFKIKMGDKPFTVLESLANIRQFFERAIEVKQSRSDLTPEMKEIYEKSLKEFKEAIPITNSEVNRLYREIKQLKPGQKGETTGEFIKRAKGASVFSAPEVTKNGDEAPEMTEEEYNAAAPGTFYRMPGDPTVRSKP